MLRQLTKTTFAFSLLALAITSAQTALAATAMTGNDVARLIASRADAEVDAGGGLDLSAALPNRIAIDGPGSRLAAIGIAAADLGARWRKVYVVVPATTANGVTTLAEAQLIVDNHGILATDLVGASPLELMRVVAAADSAHVKVVGNISQQPISLDVSHASVAGAIATIARRTNTHWTAHYVLYPDQDALIVAGNAGVQLTARSGAPTGPITEHVARNTGTNSATTQVSGQTNTSAAATTGNGFNYGSGNQNYGYNGYSTQYPYNSFYNYGRTPPVETIPGNSGLFVIP